MKKKTTKKSSKTSKISKKKYDVICVGSASLDCFMQLPINKDLNEIHHGDKVLVPKIQMLTGGGGSNVAVGISRLGLKSAFIGEIGNDLSAKMIQHNLKEEKVDILVKHHSKYQTAYSVVLEAKGKDRAILVYKGASSYLEKKEIPGSKLKTNWFYFASIIGDSLKTMNYLSDYAKKNKISIYFNPSGYMIKNGGTFFKNILKKTTIFAVNKEEAQTLLKSKSDNTHLLLKNLKKKGPKIIIITDGKNGIIAYDGKNFHHKSTNNIDVIDTTGAGDAFGTGFLTGYIKKEKDSKENQINYALSLGLFCSESVIRKTGAKNGLPKKSDIKI